MILASVSLSREELDANFPNYFGHLLVFLYKNLHNRCTCGRRYTVCLKKGVACNSLLCSIFIPILTDIQNSFTDGKSVTSCTS